MGVKFKNNAESTLAGNINGTVTTFDLAAGEGNNFPVVTAGAVDYFYVTLVDVSGNREVVLVTEHQSGDTFQTVERGVDDTSGLSFVTGDKVQMRWPKIILEDYRDDIATNAADIITNAAGIAANVAAIAAAKLLLYATAGTKMYFYQNLAPTGWTIDTGPADSLLAIKGGAQAYNSTGGQKLGSWTPTTHTHTGPSHAHTGPSHTHTGPAHTHSGPSHTHTMGTHNHAWYVYTAGLNWRSYNSAGTIIYPGSNGANRGIRTKTSDGRIEVDCYTNNVDPGDTAAAGTGSTGSGGTGATSASGTASTGADGTGATGTGSAPSTDRPQAAVGIIATKD